MRNVNVFNFYFLSNALAQIIMDLCQRLNDLSGVLSVYNDLMPSYIAVVASTSANNQ